MRKQLRLPGIWLDTGMRNGAMITLFCLAIMRTVKLCCRQRHVQGCERLDSLRKLYCMTRYQAGQLQQHTTT